MQARNPKHNAAGGIDCELEHPVYGWIPFTASASDSEALGRSVYARALTGAFGPIAPYVPTVISPVVPNAVTMRQARLVLLDAGLLGGIDAAINALPSPEKDRARIEWEYSGEVQRHNGVVSLLAPGLGLSGAQLDAMFIAASAIP